MNKTFLISLGIIAWQASMQGMDPEQAIIQITIGEKQIATRAASIRKFAPRLADLLENRVNPTDPITLPGYSDEKLNTYLETLINILHRATVILKPNPNSPAGSYKELQSSFLANKVHARHALELMLLGNAMDIDQRIINALSLQVACSNEVVTILKELKQQNLKLRADIIRQYYLHNGHQMPEETDQAQDKPVFDFTDMFIHAQRVTRGISGELAHWNET